MPNFNMSQFLERAEAPPGDSANVTEPEFLKAVDQVIVSTPLPELKTYMRWHVVHSNAHDAAEAVRRRELRLLRQDADRREGAEAALEALRRRRPTAISARRSARSTSSARSAPEGQGTHAADGRGDRGGARRPTSRRSTWMSDETKKRGRSQAARRRQQDRLSRSLARLLDAAHRPRRRLRQLAAREHVRVPPPAGQDRQARRQDGVADDAADGERLLQPAREQHQLPGRHPAAAVLQQGGATTRSTSARPARSSATS